MSKSEEKTTNKTNNNQHLIWFDLFDLQSPQLVQHSCSARMIWDSNKVIIIIITIIIIISVYFAHIPLSFHSDVTPGSAYVSCSVFGFRS